MTNVLLACVCVALLPALTAAGQGPRPDAAAIAQAIDAFVGRAVSAGITPGIGVALAMDGRVIYSKAHGQSDASAGTRADDRTLWYIASTSKSLTGFGVALLAHQGALRLEDPIAVTLPRARWHPQARAQELTLARFLSHTHNLNDDAIVSSAAYTGSVPEAQWPSLLELASPRETPGLVYSNFGYNVAAMVIDALRPEGWRRYLEAGRPEARDRAEQRLAELIARRSANLQAAGKEEAARAARQRVPLTRPVADYTGHYAQSPYGEVIISERDGRLEYRWGAVFGPAETYDASRDQLQIEIAGRVQMVTFEFAGPGPARSLSLQGVTFARSPGK
jgi:hypothetical protein